MFKGFEQVDVAVGSATLRARIGGAGEPLLLLHGYPQTHVMWHTIAEDLARTHQVIAPDLRGYGDSVARSDDFSFRAMAQDQVELMQHLGHSSFHVVSHDRGARTAHRMTLDHPKAVRSVALLDILPTLDVWRTMDDWLAMRYYHWMFLAQPGDMPQRLINGDPVHFLHAALHGLSGATEIFDAEALAAYERAARNPNVVAAWCADYRSGASTDISHDRASEGQQNQINCLVLWGSRGIVDHHVSPLEAWQAWFPNAQGHAVDAGHFLVEEQPQAVLDALLRQLSDAAEI